MGSTKWGTRNRPTRDWEQPAKKNWEHVQPTRNGEQLLNGKLGTTKFELGTTNTSGQQTGTLETQSQCIYLWVPNRGNTRYAHSTMAKRHHAGLPAPGTTETASTRHNNNKSNVTQKTANGQQGANGEQTNKRLGTTSQKLGIANRKQGTASQHNQVPTGNWVQPTPRDN
jgi:hypothetical protein